jgi:dGTPase
MRDHGGFEHNRQSLRMVEDLEVKYPEFNGLNLTWETREGLCKHLTADFAEGRYPSLEAQVADAADEIAYCTSDLDDALENTLIGPEELFEIELWDEANSQIDRLYPRLEFDRRCRFCIRLLIDKLVDDLCAESIKNIREAGLVCANDARRQDRKLAGFSLPMRAKLQNLSDFLIERFYFHMAVKETNQRACRVLQALFEFYHKRPHSIGQKAALRIKKDGVFRAICDYVAGMTDGEALKLYARHIGTDDLLNELMPDRG